eukprot:scaffold795_cov375-Prasinococcus_capsulatus_cf.AAC.5
MRMVMTTLTTLTRPETSRKLHLGYEPNAEDEELLTKHCRRRRPPASPRIAAPLASACAAECARTSTCTVNAMLSHHHHSDAY